MNTFQGNFQRSKTEPHRRSSPHQKSSFTQFSATDWTKLPVPPATPHLNLHLHVYLQAPAIWQVSHLPPPPKKDTQKEHPFYFLECENKNLTSYKEGHTHTSPPSLSPPPLLLFMDRQTGERYCSPSVPSRPPPPPAENTPLALLVWEAGRGGAPNVHCQGLYF